MHAVHRALHPDRPDYFNAPLRSAGACEFFHNLCPKYTTQHAIVKHKNKKLRRRQDLQGDSL